MQIREIMSPNAVIAAPNDTIESAAKTMAQHDIGFLPVGDDDHLLGMITDRDIAVRAVANGRNAQTLVSEVMTPDIRYCFEDDDVVDIAQNFADQQVRRMPVVDRNKRLVGVVALGDFAANHALEVESAEALEGISRPGGRHTQTGSGQF